MSGSTVSPGVTAAIAVVAARLSSLAQCLAFWTAVLLPFVYLPLIAVDPALLVDGPLLGGFVSVNLVALVVGHGHYALDDERVDATD